MCARYVPGLLHPTRVSAKAPRVKTWYASSMNARAGRTKSTATRSPNDAENAARWFRAFRDMNADTT